MRTAVRNLEQALRAYRDVFCLLVRKRAAVADTPLSGLDPTRVHGVNLFRSPWASHPPEPVSAV